MTLEQYETLLAEQAGVCAVCSKVCSTGRRLAIDHCHETGVVRGLLCFTCNMALGYAKDSPDILQRMSEYLRRLPCC